MNCCDDNGRCTGGHNCAAHKRSCVDLAVCQGREPPCADCPTPALRLAPGAVEAYRVPLFGTAAQRRHLMRWLKPSLLFTLVVTVAALAAGIVAGALQW